MLVKVAPGKWNEALKAVKIFTDFKASMVYGVLLLTIFLL